MRTGAIVLLALVGWLAGPNAARAFCFEGPERIDKGLQRYYVFNGCGMAVDLPYRVRETEGGEWQDKLWRVPACLPVKQGIAFTQWADVEFLPPSVPVSAPKPCYFATANPRDDVDVPGALALLAAAIDCPLPEEREAEGKVTFHHDKLLPRRDYLLLVAKRTVAVTNDIEIWKREFSGGSFVAYSQLDPPSQIGNGVALVLRCADGEICIKHYTEADGDCGDDIKCEVYDDTSRWVMPLCDADTAKAAMTAINELIRANTLP